MTPSLDLTALSLSPGRSNPCLAASAALLNPAELIALEQLSSALDAMAGSHPGQRARRLDIALSHFAAQTDLASLLPRQHRGRDLTAIVASSANAAPGYQRHLLLADPQGRYSAVAIVWEKDQYSPVHGHHTWCAYSVLHGALSESRFDWCETTQAAQLGAAAARLPHEVSYTDAGLGGIHRLGNPHPAAAISLHVYGVSGASVSTAVNHLVAVHT
jgi:predicted metal-dependent enzyme (double-stranded beta helix superfamily)